MAGQGVQSADQKPSRSRPGSRTGCCPTFGNGSSATFRKGHVVPQCPHSNRRASGWPCPRRSSAPGTGTRRWRSSGQAPPPPPLPARADASYEHPDTTPGTYEIVLQSWKYFDYAKNPAGEFTRSQFVDISNKVTYKI